MTLDEIKRLIEFIREQEVTEFELEQDGVKIRIKSGPPGQTLVPMIHAPAAVPGALPTTFAPQVPSTPAPAATTTVNGEEASAEPAEGPELAIVKSPIVGTFYRASDPESKPFVEVGETVRKGQVLCIIEAMKLMNEIDSEYDGEVVNIYVENGQAVQYGERLFAIKLK